jgi:predicted N-acetyltransferase YhbS
VGFVQVCWDGGLHAFLLDTAVDPGRQHHGIGTGLVRAAIADATAAGCEWLHVDFEAGLTRFYLDGCGFRPTAAGVVRLGQETRTAVRDAGSRARIPRPTSQPSGEAAEDRAAWS